MANELAAFSNELAALVERAAQSVVAVHARPRFSSSGVFWRPGIIVTAEHTIRRDEEITVTLPDGSNVAATLVGRDAGTDIAVLRVEGKSGSPVQRASADAGSRQCGAGDRPVAGFRSERHDGHHQRRQRLMADVARRSPRSLHPARPHAVSGLVRRRGGKRRWARDRHRDIGALADRGTGDSRVDHRPRGRRNPGARPRGARLSRTRTATGAVAGSSKRPDRGVARAGWSCGQGRRAHRRRVLLARRRARVATPTIFRAPWKRTASVQVVRAACCGVAAPRDLEITVGERPRRS